MLIADAFALDDTRTFVSEAGKVFIDFRTSRDDDFFSPLMEPFVDLLKLDSVVFDTRLVDKVFFSSFPFSSLCLMTFVRLGLRGASVDELGRSSDELAFDCCILSRLLTRRTRCFEPSLFVPFSRLRLEDDLVDETEDSPLLVVRTPLLVRLADDDRDESLALRGMLSMEDCEDAVWRE